MSLIDHVYNPTHNLCVVDGSQILSRRLTDDGTLEIVFKESTFTLPVFTKVYKEVYKVVDGKIVLDEVVQGKWIEPSFTEGRYEFE
jgi:hypothetical protein